MKRDMPADEFRHSGHEAVDWIADYLDSVRDLPVLPRVHPGELADALPSSGPEHGVSLDEILAGFREQIVPAITHWNHPRFLAYFAISATAPGILAEFLAAALNVNGMLWKTSPAATELEQVTLGWLREWMGLPNEFFGIVYDTASISTLHALAAAREKSAPEMRREGASPGLVVYTSEQAHSSVEKSAITLGMGQNFVRKIPVDAEFRMDTAALASAIASDVRAGLRPCCVVATCGTTSTTSVDPVREIAAVCRQHNLWLHVDASYAGSAAIAPEFRWVLDGANEADSLVANPHKWLFTPVDLSAFYTRHPDILRRAFSLIPEYLQTAADERAVNLMDYGVQLGRRFRALKLWFVMRYYGREGLATLIRSHVAYAQRLAALIAADVRFEIAAPHPLSVVCLRFRGSDDDNRSIIATVNASGRAFLSHTVLRGRFVMRVAVGNAATTWDDVAAVWELVQQAASQVAEKHQSGCL